MHHFQEEDFGKSLQILDEWEISEPELMAKITGMKAAVYLSIGDFKNGKNFMDKFVQELSPEELSDSMMSFVLDIYYKAFPVCLAEQSALEKIKFLCNIAKRIGLKGAAVAKTHSSIISGIYCRFTFMGRSGRVCRESKEIYGAC